MKKILLLLLTSGSLMAQNSTLFELSKPGIGHKSYLFGTIHMSNDQVFNFNDSLYVCLEKSGKVFFELDLATEKLSGDAMKYTVMKYLPSLDSSQIKSFFTRDLFPRIKRKISPGKMAARINNDLLPLLEKAVPLVLEHKGSRSMMMDMYLTEYARQSGKEVWGIEEIDEQMDALMGDVTIPNNFFSKKNAKKIVRFLKKGDLQNPVMKYLDGQRAITDMYHRFSLNEIDTRLNESMNPRIYERLITRRNDIMFDRTEQQALAGPVFIAVGTGHLVGENGLLNQYRAAGFTIREVDVKSNFRRAMNWEHFQNERISLDIPAGVKNFYAEAGDEPGQGSPVFTPAGLFRFSITHFPVTSPDTTEYEFEITEAYADTLQETLEEENHEILPLPEKSFTKMDKSYLGQVMEKVDFSAFLEKVMSQIKPGQNEKSDSLSFDLNGKEVFYSDFDILGKRTIDLVLEHNADSFQVIITGDSKAIDQFDWKGMISGIRFE